jgi:hypothetical protein
MSSASRSAWSQESDNDLDPNQDPSDSYFERREWEPGGGNESSSSSESESEKQDDADEVSELSSSWEVMQRPSPITFPKSPPNEFPYLRLPPRSEFSQLQRRPAPTSSDNSKPDNDGRLRPDAKPRRKSNSSTKSRSRRSSHTSDSHRSGTVFATQQTSNSRRVQHDTRSCPTRDCKECSEILYQNCRIRDSYLGQRDRSQGIRLPRRPEGTIYDLQPPAW